MEVVHSDDHVTHAVIGGNEKINFGITDDGFMMQLLSASLYKDQRLAVIRETLCNADDAHKENGVTVPFEVTLTNEKLIIRDFGPGIPHENIGAVYGTYGGSTKRGSGVATGGFGLGCKAPFAYTDNFQVTSWNQGTKTIYRMSKSDSEVNGKPSIIKIVSAPTTETGLEVNINLADAADKQSFAKRIITVLRNGGMNALYNGVQAEVYPYAEMTNGYMITSRRPLDDENEIYVKYGAVIYPIEPGEGYISEYQHVCRLIGEMESSTNHRSDSFYLLLEAQPGTLSLTPSREGLTSTPTTTETVKGLLEGFADKFRMTANVECQKLYKVAVNGAYLARDAASLKASPMEVDTYNGYLPPVGSSGNEFRITSPAQVASYVVGGTYPGRSNRDFMLRDLENRVAKLSSLSDDETMLDRGLLQGMHNTLKKAGGNTCKATELLKDHHYRKVVAPVKEAMLASDNVRHMSMHRLSVAISSCAWNEGRSYYRQRSPRIAFAGGFQVSHPGDFIELQKRVVIITHNADEARYNADQEYNRNKLKMPENLKLAGCMFYEVGRAKSKVDEAREFFSGLKGFTVYDMTKEIEYKEPRARTTKVKEKLTGFPTLRSTRNGGYFDWQLMAGSKDRIEKPEAFAELYGKSHYQGRDYLLGITSISRAEMINNRYGHRIAAVMTGAQREVMEKAGVPHLPDWISGRIIADIKEDKDLVSALPGTWRVLHRWLKKEEIHPGFIKMLLEVPSLVSALKLPVLNTLTIPQEDSLFFLKEMREQFLNISEDPFIIQLDEMEPNKQLQKFALKFKGNASLRLINSQEVRNAMEGEDPALKEKTIKLIKLIMKV